MADQNTDTTTLGELMSDLSEDCYYAGWLQGTEYFVPELCRCAIETNDRQFWGHGEILPDQARKLQVIADRINHWANMDDAAISYVPFNPFPIPRQYIESLNDEQKRALERMGVKNRQGEQAGAGQPATRPVVEPEGGVKPQPEAEGRSR